ncbi:MAG: flavin oxidoreductase, partial [Megasphaera micronuciformis]|nr:flavin oxidoreductase [Megasphaera micronuciformis]
METELTGKQAPIMPEGVFIIGTYDENGVPNAMNAAWGSQSDYSEITLFLAPHKTTENVV